jgi:hypothetical protein
MPRPSFLVIMADLTPTPIPPCMAKKKGVSLQRFLTWIWAGYAPHKSSNSGFCSWPLSEPVEIKKQAAYLQPN